MAFSVNDLKSESLELQTIPGFVPDAAQSRGKLSESRKYIKMRVPKLAFSKEVEDEITIMKKEVTKLPSSVTKVTEHHLAKDV